MATSVPNRYYNSPWIAQASQNLSEALFGSPERELQSLQMQKIRADMQHQDELDRIAAEDRATGQLGMKNLSDAFRTVKYDEKGNPTPESLNALAAVAATIPGANPINLVSPYGRTYGIGLSQAGATERTGMTTATTERGQDITATTQRRGQDITSETQRRGQDIKATTSDEDRVARLQIADKNIEARAARAAAAKGKTPYPITGTVLKDIRRGIATLERESGESLTPEDRHELEGIIGEDVQTTRNVPASLQRIWTQQVQRKRGSRWTGSVGDVLRKIGLDPQKEYLAVEPEGPSLGDVLTQPGGMPAAAPATPTQSAPPAALEYLRAHPETKAQFKAKYGYLPPGF
jgi:hypothetical protein